VLHEYDCSILLLVSIVSFDNIRYSSDDISELVIVLNPIKFDDAALVQLKEPAFGVAPGQFGVIYNGTKVVCGGRISPKVLENVG